MSQIDKKSGPQISVTRFGSETTKSQPNKSSFFETMLSRHQAALKSKDFASIDREYKATLDEPPIQKNQNSLQKQNQPTFAQDAEASNETNLLLENLEKFSQVDEIYKKGWDRKTLAQSYTSRIGTGTSERLGKFKHIIEAKAKKYDLDPNLLASLVKQESNFNPYAVSHCGAMGLGQLMPETARYLGVKDPFNAQQNLEGAAKYLREQLDTFGGDVKKALAAYNAGPGNVKKYGGIPPFEETQNYVKSIMSHMTEMNRGSYFANQTPEQKTDVIL